MTHKPIRKAVFPVAGLGTRFRQLRKRGVNAKEAILTARSTRGPWRVALTAALCWALPGAYFDSLGLPKLNEPRNV